MTALALFINSFASLLFETILLKQLGFLIGSWSYILSVVLCSFMAGSGIGALLAMNKKVPLSLSIASILQGVFVIAFSFMLMKFDAIIKISSNLMILGLLLSPPFILFGYFVTRILDKIRDERPEAVWSLYAADLFGAGSGGILGAFIILPAVGINKATFLCVLLFGITAFILRVKQGGRHMAVLTWLLGICSLPLFFYNIDSVIEKHREITHTPLHALIDQGGTLLFSGWSTLHRIDVIDSRSDLVVTFNGFPWTSFEKISDPVTVDSMLKDMHQRYLKGLYPFLHNPRQILIIGAGAGPDVFYSKVWLEKFIKADPTGNRGHIIGVEIDPLVVDLMKNRFNSFNRNIFNDPLVTIITDDGRHFLARTKATFDLIHYPGVDTPYAFTNALGINPYLRAENYLYTFEGLRSAYERLSENGALVVTVGSWLPESFSQLDFNKKINSLPRESRLVATMKMILESRGITRWFDYVEVVAYASPHGKENSMIETMIKFTKKPINTTATKRIIASYGNQSPVYVFDNTEIAKLATLSAPITDDRPFYYNFPLNVIPPVIKKPLIFFSGILIIFLAILFIHMSFWGSRRAVIAHGSIFVFFACCGIVYMIAELLYAQQATIFLGNSFLGAALLIPIFLLCGGLGSFVARAVLNCRNLWRFLYAALIALPLYNYVLPSIIGALKPRVFELPLSTKTIIFSSILLPTGFLLGLLFPIGFLLSSRFQPRVNVSLMYAVDIAGSIVGILIGVSMPIIFGYTHSVHVFSGLLFIELFILCMIARLHRST